MSKNKKAKEPVYDLKGVAQVDYQDGMQGAKSKPRLVPWLILQRRRPPENPLALRVGTKSGDLPTKSLAWASAHAA
ncbi:hypothetical protein R6254_01520 [Polaromonas sp. SM01]|nr:hypothetical protein [Polaromonas sp. SM01]